MNVSLLNVANIACTLKTETMDWQGIIPEILTFIAGGGLVGIVTLGSRKKKADVEVKVDEIKALHDTIEMVYQPTITHLNNRVAQLEDEVKVLRNQLSTERADHQKEINMMNQQILAITKALGIKATTQIRDDKGRFTKAPDEDNED